MKTLGYILLAAGVILVFATIYLALNFYFEVSKEATSISQIPQTQTQDMVGQLNKLINNLNSYIGMGVYLTVKTFILFVLIEGGYKISQIGLSMVKGEAKEKEKK